MTIEKKVRLEKRTISIAVPSGFEPCSVEALCAGGLALHKTLTQTLKASARSRFYTITHIASSRAITRVLRPYQAARAVLYKLLAAGIDWTLDAGQLEKTYGLDKFRELLAAVKV